MERTVSIVQQAPVFLNLEASVERAIESIAMAAENGSDLVVFPETWLPGYPVWLDYAPRAAIWDEPGFKALFELLFNNSIQLGDRHCRRLQSAVDRADVVVAIGVNERVGGTLFNSILYFESGREIVVHRKLMPTYSERMIWGRGDGSTLAVIDSRAGRVGGLICWEHWMPLGRAAMHALGEDIHVALWPCVKEMNLVASRHYAFEGRCFVVAAGCVLTLGDVLAGCETVDRTGSRIAVGALRQISDDPAQLLLDGGSAIVAPDGSFVLAADESRSTRLSGKVDLGIRTRELMTLDAAGHYSRPDVLRLTVDTTPQVGVVFDAAPVDPGLMDADKGGS